jgi:heme exporter protein B
VALQDAINSMLFFALIIVVLFSLAFDPTREVSRQIAGGILCVATMFASVTALNQTWARELRHQVLDAQRMAPAPASSLFLAKVLVNFLFVSVVQLALAPLFIIFYNLRSVGPAWPLLLVLPLGTWALDCQRDLLRRALHPHSQPRTAAAADFVSDLHPGVAGHGARHDRRPHRRG